MKRVCLIVTLVLFLFLTSCGEDTTGLAKEEFSKYYNGKNEVVLNIEDNLYFENCTIDLNSLVEKGEHNNGLMITQEKLFFSISVENSNFNFSFNIYKSNLKGTNIEIVFSKDGYKTHPHAHAENGVFYIEHYSNSTLDSKSKLIDKYTISTGVYENVDSGKDCALSDYMPKEEQNRYSVEVIENITPQKHGKFIITDLETGTVKIIDDDYLKQTVYIESMEKFNYSPKRVDFSNGHILLTYGIGAGDGWNYAHLVFDYDFDSNTIEYKLLAFPFDSVPIEIIYIG